MAPLPAAASGVGADDFSLYVSLASDYVFRGYSQTREDPALQFALDFEHESGVFAGIWGSNVDFPPLRGREDPRDIQLQIYAGYGIDLGKGIGLSTSINRYEYPRGDRLIDWDYNEVSLALHRDRTVLSAAYSDSALGSGAEGIALDLTNRWPLGQRTDLGAGFGYYDLEARFLKDYLYWSAEISHTLERWTLGLGYFDTDSRGEDVWGDRATARLVATISYRIH